MKKTIILIVLLSINIMLSQGNIKLIKATSQKISIKDGDKPISKDWNWLTANKNTTVFELEKNKSKRKVVFYTDIDSIQFNVESNKKYNFKVVLNSKDTCYVQLSTVIPTYKKNCSNCEITSDTIPFFLGEDNNIHIKTKVNNSQDLDFIFDTGAGVVCLTAKGFKKSKTILDGNVENVGFGGVTTEKTSSSNKLEINDLVWNNLSILCLDCTNENANENANEKGIDGILGYNIFEDKVVEIDYDKSILIVHSKLPNSVTKFTKLETKENLFIKIKLNNGGKSKTGWFFFDTGSDGNLIVGKQFIANTNLFENMKVLGKGKSTGTGGEVKNNLVMLPGLTVADDSLFNIPIALSIDQYDDNFYKDGIIGNRILKRFNTVIDYPNLTVYLKPNSFFNDSFKKKDKTSTYIIISTAFAFIIGFILFLIRRKKNK